MSLSKSSAISKFAVANGNTSLLIGFPVTWRSGSNEGREQDAGDGSTVGAFSIKGPAHSQPRLVGLHPVGMVSISFEPGMRHAQPGLRSMLTLSPVLTPHLGVLSLSFSNPVDPFARTFIAAVAQILLPCGIPQVLPQVLPDLLHPIRV